eukprot:NODE_389_length_8228_cov_1.280600.p7 type:complete len:107 gc:universal NODE_389_length_8228_cov_1.280600:4218-3898(-)
MTGLNLCIIDLRRMKPSSEFSLFLIANLITAVFSFGISYASSWCVRVVNSTTYSMVGALNKLPISIAGLLFFGVPVTFGSVGSILLGFAAGLLYTKAKIIIDQSKS